MSKSIEEVSVSLNQDDLSEIENIKISKALKVKIDRARILLRVQLTGVRAIESLTPEQKTALLLAVGLMRFEQLPKSKMAREAAIWWTTGARALILCVEDMTPGSENSPDFGLELIPPDQDVSLRPENNKFDSLNLGWFNSEAEAFAEAEKLGLTIVGVERPCGGSE